MRGQFATVVLWLTIPLMVAGMLTLSLFEVYWIEWGWLVVVGLAIVVVCRPPKSLSALRFLQREFLVAAIGAALLIVSCLSGMVVDREFQFGDWVFVLRVVETRLRNENHLCLNCRYNLTGNTSGVCPECGQLSAETGEMKG